MTYADGFNLRNPTLYSANNVADAVDGLLCSSSSGGSTALVTHATTSYDYYTDLAVSFTAASGQRVLVLASLSVSAGTANDQITARITRNGTAIGTEQACSPGRSSVAGADHVIALMVVDTSPDVGVNSYRIQWVNSTAARTIYSVRARIDCVGVRVS